MEETTQATKTRGKGTAMLWVAGLALLGAVAAGAWWMLRAEGEGGPLALAPTSVVNAPPVAKTEAPLPQLEGTDDQIRRLASALSGHALFERWLEGGDLARRFVSVIYNVSEGQVPRSTLAFLSPGRGFQVEERGEVLVVSDSSFERYDLVTAVMASIDARRAGEAWRTLEPVFEAAHREIAPPNRSVRSTLSSALSHLIATPLPEGEVEVVEKGAVYAYADPKLETLSPAQKQLLRMGAKNAQVIQQKLVQLRDAAGLTSASR